MALVSDRANFYDQDIKHKAKSEFDG